MEPSLKYGRLAYSPDSYCYEYSYEVGINKLIENLRSDLIRYDALVYIAGNVPHEIIEIIPQRLVIETQLPR